MKTKISTIKRLLLLLCCMTVFNVAWAQVPNAYRLRIANVTQPTPTQLEFDIFLQNADPATQWELNLFQFGLGYDKAMLNGGTPTITILGGSELTNVNQHPNNITLGITDEVNPVKNGITYPGTYRYINCAPRSAPGFGNGSIISQVDGGCTHPGTKMIRLRLNNSVPFLANSTSKFIWNVAAGSGRTATTISAYNVSTGLSVAVTNTTTNPSGMVVYNTAGTCDPNAPLNPPAACNAVAAFSNAVSPTCFGGTNGSIQVTVSGDGSTPTGSYVVDGSASQTYNTNPFTISGLTAGNHTIVVTNAGATCSTPSTPFSITAPADPNDGNACTIDACDPGTGAITHTPVSIDDNNACTSDACDPGTGAITHTPIAGIDDNNACTNDACDPATGNISHTPIAGIDDGNACTDDACAPATGNITHTPIAGIDDGDACTTDACDPANGNITHTAVPTDDGDACTTDACDPATGNVTHTANWGQDANLCDVESCDPATGNISHTPVAGINDNNECTVDACDPATGAITHTPVAGIDDGNACTVDNCDPATGAITHTAVPTDDGDACTTDACDPATGNVTHTANWGQDANLCDVESCDPATGNISHTPVAGINDNNECTVDACDPATGAITHTPVAGIDDGNACTTDNCDPATGAITHTAVPTDDGDACTTDACDPATGNITHTANWGQDANLCDVESCDPATGNISHTPIAGINDNNECTVDACDPATGAITHTAVPTDDGDACTTDACDPATGNVTHTANWGQDANLCDVESCDPATGNISHTPVAGINDNNECTVDACDPATGAITHTPVAGIDDGDACTTDACDPATGNITHTANWGQDANLCDVESCDPATGNISHTPIAGINDNNECTVDACDPATGAITHTAVPTDDGDACTTDACDPATGNVTHTANWGQDANLCDTESCDPATGNISHTPIAGINDNNECTVDACDPATGAITHTPVAGIDDGNACTTDNCDPATGAITHTAVPTDDGDACTTDACDPATGNITHTANWGQDANLCDVESCDPATGNISHTPIAGINDNNECTVDACDPATGAITHTAVPTDDGDACTTDACDPATGNVTHTANWGQDANLCDVESCDPATGNISHTPIAGINDNNECTVDACDPATGAITHTPVAGIDDGDACTTDACDPATGNITHTANWGQDANLCDVESCDPATGNISHTPIAGINDNNECTVDACDPATGAITHTAVPTDDGDACTTDACDPATGNVTHTANWGQDANLCDTESCDPATGNISHTPIAGINDNDACTNDACDPATGAITHTPNWGQDANLCDTESCDPATGNISHTPVAEICNNGIDDDCDGLTDEGCGCANPPTAYAGADQQVCTGSNVSLTGVLGGSATMGTWSTSTGGTFTPNANDMNATYIPSALDYSNGSVTITLCTDAGGVNCDPMCDQMTVTFLAAPASPGPISGAGDLCNPTTGATFSVAPVAGATSYTWTVPPGTVIVSGQGTTSILCAWTTNTIHNGIIGQVCVQANNSNGCGASAPSCAPLTVQQVRPVQPGSISGPARACPGETHVYSCAPIARTTSYNWTVPTGATVTAGQGTNTVSVTYDAAFTSAGTISVTASNGCGTSPARTRGVQPNNLPAPATISGPANGVCGMTGVMYCASAVPGATEYLWTIVGTGATINGPDNGACVSIDFGTFTSVSVVVRAVNGCGNGSTRSLTVMGRPAIPGPISGPTTVCANQTYPYSVSTVTGTSTYNWTVPGGAVIMSGAGTKDITVKFGPVPASNLTITVRAGNACGLSAARALNGITIQACARISDNASTTALNAYPNPVKDLLNVNFTSSVAQQYAVKMTDMTGRVVFGDVNTAAEGVNNLSFDVKGLSSGVYMLNFQMSDVNEQIRVIVE